MINQTNFLSGPFIKSAHWKKFQGVAISVTLSFAILLSVFTLVNGQQASIASAQPAISSRLFPLSTKMVKPPVSVALSDGDAAALPHNVFADNASIAMNEEVHWPASLLPGNNANLFIPYSQIEPGPISITMTQISASSPHRADGVDAATIIVTATDSLGLPIPGTSVWIVASGTDNVIANSPGTTNADGVYSTTLTSKQSEAKVIKALIGDGQEMNWLPAHAFVEFTGAVIMGTVFSDPNRDNARQSGEFGLGGVQISLYRDRDTEFLKQTVTESDGRYSFTGLVSDTYRIAQPQFGSYAFSQAGDVIVNVTDFAAVSDINFGAYDAAHVIGRVWNDGNQDGQIQEGEPGIANAIVSAYDDQSALIGSTTTSVSGDYQLDLAADLPTAPNNFTFSGERFRIQEPTTAVANNFDFTETPEIVYYPLNHDFVDGRILLPESSYPPNYGFTEGRVLLPTSTFPSNYNFDSGDLTGWAASNTSYVQVISSVNSIDGPYLYIGRETESIESAPFTVPATAQSVRFDYAAWYPANSTHNRKIHVYALTGPNFITSTYLGDVTGRGTLGWQQGVLDLQAVQGQTIKLRFYLENVIDSRARLDNVVLAVETPDWTPSDVSHGYVQVISSVNSIDGPYLYIGRETESIESAPFTVPATAQSVRFDYAAWYIANSTHNRKIHVYALTGPNFITSTYLGDVTGKGTLGWQQGVLDLQAVQGQTIKLRFYLEDVVDSRARLDNVVLAVETPDWTPSNVSHGYIQVISDVNSIDGPYLYIGRETESIESAPFTVPATAQSVRFDYAAWYIANSTHNRKLHVYALTGPNFITSTHLGYVIGRGTLGWQQGVLDLQAVQGQTIKLRFYLEDVVDSRARLDNVVLAVETPDWTPSNVSHGYIQVISDVNSIDGPYLYIGRETESIESAPFTVPATAQSVRFDYAAWYIANSTHNRKLHVYALTGPNFITSTHLGYVIGRGTLGWQQGVLDLQAVQGQTIKLRFYLEDVVDSRARLDNVVLAVETPDWTPSNVSHGYIQVISDVNSIDGPYLYIGRETESIESAPFTVPATAQSVRFDYAAWYIANSTHNRKLHVYALTGPNLITSTHLGYVIGRGTLGWQQGVLDLQAVQGQTIKLRFYLEDVVGSRARLDNIYVLPYSTIPYTIMQSNLPNYTSTTPDTFGVDAYGGAAFYFDFGDFFVDAYNSTVEVAPTTVVADGVATAVVTVTLHDSQNTPLPGYAIEIDTPGQNVTVTQPISPTDALGQAVGTVLATYAPQTVLVSARSITDNVTLNQALPITFTPGLADPARSSFAVDITNIVANGVDAAPFTVILRDQYNNLIAGHPVTLTHTGSEVAVTFDSAETDAFGRVTGDIRSSVAQIIMLQAHDAVDGITLNDTAVITITTTDPALSSLDAFPDSVVADGTSTAVVTVTLRDQNGYPLPGKPVHLDIAGADSFLNGQPVTGQALIGQSGSDGVVTASLSSTALGVKTIQAYGDGILLDAQTQVTFTVGPVDPSASQLATDLDTLFADGVERAVVTAILYDSYNHPIPNKTTLIQTTGTNVTVDQPITLSDAQGIVTATIRSTDVQTVTVTAVNQTDSITLTQTIPLTFTVGPADPDQSTLIISPTTVLADGVQTATITATLRDVLGHPAANRVAQITVTDGSYTVSPAAQGDTDAEGTIVFDLASTTVGTLTVSMRDVAYDVLLPSQPIVFVEGFVDPTASQLTADKTVIIADGLDTANVTAILYDSYGHPISDKDVTIQAAGSGITVTQLVNITNEQGQVQAEISSTTIQTATVTAVDQTDNLTLTQVVTLTFTPIPADGTNSTIAVTPTTLLANGVQTATITATLRDVFNQPLADRPIELLVAGSANTIAPSAQQNTDGDGNIVFTLSSTRAETKQISLHDVEGGVTLLAGSAIFEPVPVDPAHSLIVVVGSATAAADGIDTVNIQATVRDAFDNNIPNATVILTSTGPVDFIQPPLTNQNGQATGQASSAVAGMAVIQAIVNDILINDSVAVTFVGADLSIRKSGPAETVAGFPISYTITVENEGLLAATSVVVTDTLPAAVAYTTSSYSATVSGSDIAWHLGAILPGSAFDIVLEGVVAGGAANSTIQNNVVAAQSSSELDLSDNAYAMSSDVVEPHPILFIPAQFPNLIVPQGGANELVVDVSNTGTDLLTAVVISPSATLPEWITVAPTDLGNIPYQNGGNTLPFTITADAGVAAPGYYRDIVTIQTGNAGTLPIYLTVQVQNAPRDLQLNLINDSGYPVEDAMVTLVEQLYIVTQGQVGYENYYWQGSSDADGRLIFPGLESGKDYEFNITAPNHQSASGVITLGAGVGAQIEDIELIGLPGLVVQPEALIFSATRGQTKQRQLVLFNQGAAPVIIQNIDSPADLPWVYLGQPPEGTVLAPGEQLPVLVNATPTISETADIYQGDITVIGNGGISVVTPVEIQLNDGLTRTLQIQVLTEGDYQPLSNATVVLENQTGLIVANGIVTETLDQVLVAQTDADGYVTLTNLIPGPYLATVGMGDDYLGEKEIEVVPGDGVQQEVIIVEEGGLVTTFSVTPGVIPDTYTTVMTMTFIPHATPRVTMYPRNVNLCDAPVEGITETITIHNFYNVSFSNVQINMQTYGNVAARLTTLDGSQSVSFDPASELTAPSLNIGTLPPNSDAVQLLLNAQLVNGTCADRSQGGVSLHATGEWVHAPPQSWYSFVPFQTPYLIEPDGIPHDIPLVLSNAGYPAEANLHTDPPILKDITLTPPQALSWMGIDTTHVVSLPVGSDFTFNLIVTPTQWLAPGFYYDHILIQATNGITGLIGIEAEMTEGGLRVEAQLITPLYTSAEGSAAAENAVVNHGRPPGLAFTNNFIPPGQDNGSNLLERVWAELADLYNESPTVTLLDENWELNVGCDCGSDPVVWTPIGNQLIASGPAAGSWAPVAHAPDFKENVVILRLEQRYSFEREAFFAQLDLDNGSYSELSDFSVDLSITTISGEQVTLRLPGDVMSPTTPFEPVLPVTSTLVSTETLRSQMPGYWAEIPPVNFIVIPEEVDVPNLGPTGSISNSHTINWTIVPDAFGLEEAMGEQFFVSAAINYSKNGVPQPTIATTEESIWVHPQPRLMLDYFVPDYVYGGETFDWVVVVTNIGYGTARNFRIETPQPVIVQQSELYPTDFTLLGEPVLHVGDIGPGDQFVDAWRIIPSNPGTFVDWQATCVHENYMGVELPPLMNCEPNIHVLHVEPPLDESQQWGKENSCLVGSYQGFDSDPVNTFSGNFTYNALDVNVPTWGQSLQFERSYNSRDEEAGPLGPGWTHNYNMNLVRETFVPLGGFEASDYMVVRMPRGSRAYFEIGADGTTFTPLPGVRASLVWDNIAQEYTLTQPNDLTKYIFHANQYLLAIEDANSNRISFDYTSETVNNITNYYLTAVTGPAGRQLTLTYDDDWHIASMTDPLGRTYTYNYTDGYLTGATDFRGQTTQYTYTTPGGVAPGQLESIIDANGRTELTNSYNNQRRVYQQTGALGNVTTFAYLTDLYAGTRATIITDPNGNETTDVYDADGRIVERRDAHGFFESYTYNADNNLTRLVDKNGHETNYEWNACGCDVARVTDPLGNVTIMTHDANNQVIGIQDERGYATTIDYDAHANPVTTTNPLGGTVVRTYGAYGQLLSETDENGYTTFFGYDAYGHTAIITNALNHTTFMTYDLVGRLLNSTDALGRETTYAYDPGDNLLAVSAPLSATTTFAYDNVGNLVNTTDALGRLTTYVYGARNQQTLITDPLGNTQSFVYDAAGNMAAATDENGNTTTYQYDGLNRVTAVTNPLSGAFRTSYDPVGNILAETDANGNVTQYLYDANDRRVDTVYADGSVMHATYDAADNMLTLTDAEGRAVAYTYDALGRTLTKSDPTTIGTNGGVTTYGYDAVGNQISLIDAENRTTLYEYDALNRLARVTNPISGTTSIGYDAVGNRINLTDANGRIATFTYDDLNRLIATTNPLSGTTTFEYDAVGNQLRVVNPLGQATTTAYDDLNRPAAMTNALTGTVAFTYDGVGNLLTETDEEGRVTAYEYDVLYRTAVITNALGHVTTLAYDANGNLISEIDPEGRTAVYEYDNLNQLVRVTDPLSGTISYAYDNVGNRIGVTDANGHSMAYLFDGLDRMVAASDALGNATTYAYDKVGNLLMLTDAAGSSTTYGYDNLDRVVTFSDALGGQTTTTYDDVGNVLTATDAEGRTVTFAYDALGRPLQATDPLGQSTTYAYDAIGNQSAVTDTIGRVTIFEYDALNRLTAAIDPLGQTTVFTYSLAGDVLSEQNPLGQVTAYRYDALGRLTQAINPLTQAVTTTYDAVGNPVSVTDAAGRTTQFAYDDLNRLALVTGPLGGVTVYTYDAVGNQVSLTNANNQTIAFAYDAANRLTAVTDPLNQTTTFAYDAVGNQISLTDPLSRTTAYAYDALYRLTALTDAAGNETQYVYDAVGNQIGLTDAEGRVTTILYDVLNRPIAATNPLSGTTQFIYDAAGRLINEIDAAGRVITYTYDALDRLATAVDPLGNVTANQYDALGNLTSLTDALNRATTYQYDALNRLVQVTNPLSGTTQFAYDPAGNLVQQLDPLGTAVVYQYDALDRVITETNVLGDATAYTYDAIGNLTAVTDANDHTAQMTYDALNRLQTVTDPVGELTHYNYDAVGNNTAILDPLGRTTQFSYDILDRLIAVTDPLSRTTTYAYDRVNNQIGLTDAAGVTTRYAYDALNRLAQVTENHIPGGPVDEQTNVASQFAYDTVGNLTAMTNPLGNNFTFAYDPLNRLVNSADPLGNGSSYNYDPVGNLTQVVDANGATTTYAYDALNRLNGITRPDEMVGFTYDAVGNRLTMSDPTGVTAYAYDALYRLTQVTDPLSQTVQYGYDAVSNRTSLVYPGGEAAIYTYDTANRLQTIADWDAGITQYDYDAIGRLVQMVLPNSIASSYSYDAADQLTGIQHTHPVSGELASYVYAYDQAGNRIQAIETVLLPDTIAPTAVFTATPRAGTTPLIVAFFNNSTNADEYVWDFGDGISVTTTSAAPISHTYATAGLFTVSLTAVNEQYSHTLTQENYISVIPADAFQEVDGLVVLEAENAYVAIPRNGQSWITATTFSGYTGATYFQARPDIGALYESGYAFASPELQFQVNFVNPGNYVVWARGAATNAAGDSIHIGLDGTANADSEALTGFRFNEWDWSAGTMSGLTATIEIPAPGVYTINVWAREDGVRLDRLALSLNPGFTPVGDGPTESPRVGEAQAALFTAPHSTATTALTLNDSYVQSVARQQRMALLWAQVLANPAGLAMGPLALIAPFGYDRRRRKKSQVATAVILALVILGVGFALASGGGLVEGNPLSVVSNPLSVDGNSEYGSRSTEYALQPGGATVIVYEYDPLYRLTGATYDTGQSFGYAYDAAGNRLSASVGGAPAVTYAYDAANRLTQTHDLIAQTIADYIYDNNGNLLDDGQYAYIYDTANRLTSVNDGISTMSYVYNGDGARTAQIVDGLRTDYVQDTATALPQVLTARQGGTVSNYLQGLGLIGEQRGGTGGGAGTAVWQYHLPDALGSVRQVVDAQGAVMLGREYDPFGGLITDVGAATTNYGFAGEEQDPTTEQLYLRARTYNPGTGRFLQQDSLLGSPNQPRTLHRYTYGFNNPVNYTDPSGHMPPGGNGGGGNGGGSNAPPYVGGTAQPSSSSPNRSANDGRPNTYSDAAARGKSQGWRQSACGLLNDLYETTVGLVDHLNQVDESLNAFIQNVQAFAQDPANPSHLIDAYENLRQAAQETGVAYRSAKAFAQRSVEHAVAIAAAVAESPAVKLITQVLISLSPVDWLFDLSSLVVGYDVITGIELSEFEKGAIFLGLLTVGIGDDLLLLGTRVSRYADEAAEGVEFAAKHADELEDAARIATKHSDELEGIATWTARHGEDVLSEARIAQRLDDVYVTRADDVTTLTRKSGDEVDFTRPYSGSDHAQTNGVSKNNKYQIDDSNSSINSSLNDSNDIDRKGLVNEALHMLESTPEGEKVLSEARKLGIPKVEFRKMEAAGSFNENKNVIILNQQFLHAQPEIIAPTLAHELTHRIHRWHTASIDDELLSFGSQARVWSDLQTRVSSKNLSGFALDRYNQNNRILDFSRRQDDTLRNYIRNLYPGLPEQGRSLIDDPYYKSIIQNKGL